MMCHQHLKSLLRCSGDRTPNEYRRSDVRELIDRMLNEGAKTATINRRLGVVRSAFNYVTKHHDLFDQQQHSFKDFEIPDRGLDAVQRDDFSQYQLETLRIQLQNRTDDISRLICLMLDTGLRVSEACSLRRDDLHNLGNSTPFVALHRDPTRKRKTKNSQRFIPLIGVALKAVQHDTGCDYLFPKYVDLKNVKFKNDNASGACNKRIRSILGADAPTAHSFRHTMNTRLRDSNCPKDVRDELQGWSSSVSDRYGSPTDIRKKQAYLIDSLEWDDSGWVPNS